jgi:hypothetical protein
MKYILPIFLLSACSTIDADLQAHLEAERDFAAHQQYIESIYNLDNYDPEYVDDCLYYEEVVCEFE